MPPNALYNFHLPLRRDVYRQLKREAHASGQSVTAVVRAAIGFWFRQRRRVLLHKAIAEYARENASTPTDLDKDLEAAGIEHLLSDESMA